VKPVNKKIKIYRESPVGAIYKMIKNGNVKNQDEFAE